MVIAAAAAGVAAATVVAVSAATAVVGESASASTASTTGEEKNKDYDPAAVVTKHIGFLLVCLNCFETFHTTIYANVLFVLQIFSLKEK